MLLTLALLLLPCSVQEEESQVDRFLRLALEASPVVRPQAARRLVGLGDEAAARVLEVSGREPRGYAELGQHVVEVLGELPGEELRADLWRVLSEPDFPWRPSAARTLAGTALEQEAQRFVGCLSDPLAAVRAAAVLGLGAIGDSARIDAVRPLLSDPHDRVRREAACLLDQWGEPRTLLHLVEDLKREDRFFDVQTGKVARFEAIRLLERRFGDRFGFSPQEPPTTPANAAAIDRFRRAVEDLAGVQGYDLPEVARTTEAPAGVVGLEVRSCRRGEFFLRWTAEDVLLLGTGNPVRIPLSPGTTAALAGRAEAAFDALGPAVFWGRPGCDSEVFTLAGAQPGSLRISKGPEAAPGLRPDPLGDLARAMIAGLPAALALEVEGALEAVGGVPHPASEPKVLLVFVDGFLPDAIAKTDTPALDRLMRNAAWSLEARAESTTISGSGWSSFVSGVHWDKHNVPDNAFEAPRYDRYPHVIARLQEANPEAYTVSANCWDPIEKGLVLPARPDHVIFHEYYDTSDDYWDDKSCDTLMARDLAQHLQSSPADLAVIMFGELDGVGHSDSNEHYHAADALYQKMLAKIDGELGWLLDAIEARTSYESEDWLVIVSSDHGGAQGSGHGRNIPSHRKIPLIVSGPSVAHGEIWPPPQPVDIAVTALHHLGVTPAAEWGLDGIPLGRAVTARPPATLGRNLIFNGDAEHERGFAHYTGVPDASVAGWDDPSWMTTVVYDATDGFPGAGDPLPDDRGGSFFAGGGTAETTWMEQEIDLRPLADEITAGVTFELSAWLGGFAAQGDLCTFSVTFQAADGEPLETVTLGPVTVVDRGGETGLHHVQAAGDVPGATRRARVRLEAVAQAGNNDGYADNLSLILR